MKLTSVLTVIFVVLKLVGVISWSWFWCLFPLIIGVIYTVTMLILRALIEVLRAK